MMNSKVTYRQQYTRCGKPRCHKCREGTGHGPYWYAYWSENGRTVSKYIGTQLPDHLAGSQTATGSKAHEGLSHKPSLSAPSLSLRIYLLGQFRIERHVNGTWQAVDSRTWQRRRARALLGCLLSAPGRRLGREQVMELLWPDLDSDVAANRLNGAVHELRQILEPDLARPAASRLLRLERDILELADSSHIWVDAEAFERLLKEAYATSDTKQAEALLEEAAALYQGSYLLEELYAEWAAPRRDALQRAWIGLLLKLANLQVEQYAYIKAIDTLDRLRTADPTNETALQRLMSLLTLLDRRGEALQIYRQHVVMLKREYESEPLPETTALYERLCQGHIPTLPGVKKPEPQAQKPIREQQEETTPQRRAPQQISFTRPVFQLGRQNQSPLIGRERELALMRQVLLSVETAPAQTGLRSHEKSERGTSAGHLHASTPRPGRPRFILLKGESGIGKTRLAEEISLEGYRQGWAVAWSRSYEQEGAIPYRPWTELLRALLQGTDTFTELLQFAASSVDEDKSSYALSFKVERLGALLPEFAVQTAAHSQRMAPPAQHEQERLHLWEATLGLLNTLSRTHPLLLVFDDLHWADDSSLELLTYLTHHLQNQRILFIGTCRDGELAPQHKLRTLIQDLHREQVITTINVQPLTLSQIGTLVSHLSKSAVESIQKQASGNPFFAEELARYIGGAPGSSDGASRSLHDRSSPEATLHLLTSSPPKTEQGLPRLEVSLPEAIAAVLERRLSKLSKACQNLLGKAAILGGSFAFNQLLPMAGELSEDAVLDLLDEALRAGLLIEEGTGAHISYHFWHPLIINHLYSHLSAARRAQLHRKAAEAIKGSVPPSQQEKVAAAIVYHLNRGGSNPQSIAYYAELAGHQAYTLTAYSEAQHYYLQALQALMGHDQQKTQQGAVPIQIRALTTRDIAQIATDTPLHICHLLEYIAECSIILGHFQEARHLYECILDLRTNVYHLPGGHAEAVPATGQEQARRQEIQIQALLWREIGNTWLYTGEYDQAYTCYERGLATLSQAGISEGAAWACLQTEQGDLFRLQGNYQEAQRHLEKALEMLKRVVQPDAADPLPLSQIQESKSGGAKGPQTRIERALNGNPLEIGYAHERLAIVLASIGQLSNALIHMHTALRIYEQGELVSGMARVCGNLGAVYVMCSENSSARTYMHRALNLAERIGDLPNAAFAMVNLGEVAHRSGDLQEGERWLNQSLVLCEQINDRERLSWCHADLAGVQLDQGHTPQAREHIRHAITIGRKIKSPRCIHYALVFLGDLRTAEALVAAREHAQNYQPGDQLPAHSRSLLLRAKSTLEHAIALEEMEIETIIEGRNLLATVHFLLGDLERAQAIAQQTLHEAQGQEAIRSLGRTHRLLGYIFAARQDHRQAIRSFEQAMQIFRERDLRLDYARTLYGYGITLIKGPGVSASEASNVIQIGEQAASEGYKRGMAYLEEAQTTLAACQAALDLDWTEQTLADVKAMHIGIC